jgi:hypothetical protein
VPDSLLKEVLQFLRNAKAQLNPVEPFPIDPLAQAWAAWFDQVDRLEVTPTEPTSDYQKHLLTKYQQQGISL